jgi:hypothetical protein
MTSEHNVSKGTKWMIGAPANPMPAERVRRIEKLLAGIPAVREAHLPQCFAEGFTPQPAQILFVLLEPSANVEATMQAIGRGLSNGLVPAGESLDMLPLHEGHQLLDAVRGAGMIFFKKEAVTSKPSFFRRLFGG